ncbi:MAG: hypothetical protein F4091_00900 [Acidimicrobiales bacterium]|nr:hypothetical protein [Acidimicrobiales bacterium]MYD83192.1 hypothetical protein [Acidimicrobiales bacterium]MYJ64015.1 hypothetical protein [Acidimicrobiales bacterium]
MLSEADLGQDALVERLRKLAAEKLTHKMIPEFMISERSRKPRCQPAGRMLAEELRVLPDALRHGPDVVSV